MRDRRSGRWRIQVLLAIAALGCCARIAAAQVVEVGAGLSRGCTGDSTGFCSDDTGQMMSLYGGLACHRLQISGGVRLHNFSGENLSSSELYMQAGILFSAARSRSTPARTN
jgi:hypothetical protein